MRNYRAGRGLFPERPYYEAAEIEDLCAQELRKLALYPSRPEPVRIERFVEKRFGITVEYNDIEEGILGFTRFGPKGVEGIVVAKALADEAGKVAERRINTTLAHEAGHGLLHTHLFVLQEAAVSMFGADFDVRSPKIMCRDVLTPERRLIVYDGRWWEYQANQAIGALLMPRTLVEQCITSLLTPSGSFGLQVLRPEKVTAAVRLLADTFNVNAAVAKIRIHQLFPESDATQLTL